MNNEKVILEMHGLTIKMLDVLVLDKWLVQMNQAKSLIEQQLKAKPMDIHLLSANQILEHDIKGITPRMIKISEEVADYMEEKYDLHLKSMKNEEVIKPQMTPNK